MDENTEPACLSMAARMKMQAAAAAKERLPSKCTMLLLLLRNTHHQEVCNKKI